MGGMVELFDCETLCSSPSPSSPSSSYRSIRLPTPTLTRSLTINPQSHGIVPRRQSVASTTASPPTVTRPTAASHPPVARPARSTPARILTTTFSRPLLAPPFLAFESTMRLHRDRLLPTQPPRALSLPTRPPRAPRHRPARAPAPLPYSRPGCEKRFRYACLLNAQKQVHEKKVSAVWAWVAGPSCYHCETSCSPAVPLLPYHATSLPNVV